MISAVVLTKNEERNIKDYIESVKWCDEIVVIDDYSDDKTVEIAKSLGAKIYKRKLNGDFAAQRNFGLEKAKGEWVLFLDADERVSVELRKEVTSDVQVQIHSRGENLSTPREWADGYFVKRRDVLWGKALKHGESGDIKILRLGRKGSGKWRRKVHEVWEITGNVGELRGELLHLPHQTISEFLNDINRYSTTHAEENMREGKHSTILKLLLFPKLKFFQNYMFKLGFLDGGHGFVSAVMMSFHSYLAWSKLWLMQNSKN